MLSIFGRYSEKFQRKFEEKSENSPVFFPREVSDSKYRRKFNFSELIMGAFSLYGIEVTNELINCNNSEVLYNSCTAEIRWYKFYYDISIWYHRKYQQIIFMMFVVIMTITWCRRKWHYVVKNKLRYHTLMIRVWMTSICGFVWCIKWQKLSTHSPNKRTSSSFSFSVFTDLEIDSFTILNKYSIAYI